jgi:chemotaxis protein MotB
MSAKGSSGQQPVIIIKKGGHGKHGHHGGAWKVAYADFVTAMMAFFLVMWIVGQSDEVKAGVAGYFRDPTGFTEGGGGDGVLPGADSGATGGGAPQGNPQPTVEEAQNALEEAAESIRQALSSLPEFQHLKDQIEVSITEEGLRIELRDAPDDGFFDSGSAQVKPTTEALLMIIASQLAELPNRVAVEGHTDSRPYSADTSRMYSNWELSADRANAARRILEVSGLQHGQIEAVRGFADVRLRKPDAPMDPGNRRISIVVRRG